MPPLGGFRDLHITKLSSAYNLIMRKELKHLHNLANRIGILKQEYAATYQKELINNIRANQSAYYEHYLLLKGAITLYYMSHDYSSDKFADYMMHLNEHVSFEETMEDMSIRLLEDK
jgi:hypothetical protein